MVPTASSISFDCTDDQLYTKLSDSQGTPTPSSILMHIRHSGIVPTDPRLAHVFKLISEYKPDEPLSKVQLLEIGKDNLTLLHQIACKELVISNFSQFANNIHAVYDMVLPDNSGHNADYIPVLRNADPEKFGVAFCSVDGQFLEIGDSRDFFSIQSTSKALTFALALEKLQSEKFLKWVGIEPSGRAFNDTTFLPDARPFNPMVNAGALMTAGVLAGAYPDVLARDGEVAPGPDGSRGKVLWTELLQPLWTRMCGNGIYGDVGFSDDVFLSERRTADNNRGLAYLLKARRGLPDGVDPGTMLDLYLRACATTANAAGMAVMAATLANGGRSPYSGEQVLDVDVVKKTLSVLTLCGFYDSAGEFFFHTGIPSKSGVSGIVFMVLPNVGGFAIFSPRLDQYGNSVRATSFARHLVDLFTFHSFDSLSSAAAGCKLDPRFSCDFSANRRLSRMRWALAAGDQRTRAFEAFFVDVCLRIAQIDNKVDETEVDKLQEVYLHTMGTLLSRERIKNAIETIGDASGSKARDALIKLVQSHRRELDDTQKELVLEASFNVSTADGTVSDRERSLLKSLAETLHVPSIVIGIKLQHWTTNGSPN